MKGHSNSNVENIVYIFRYIIKEMKLMQKLSVFQRNGLLIEQIVTSIMKDWY